MIKQVMASVVLALGAPGAAGASAHHPPASCHKTFTVYMAKRAFRTVYAGHRRVTARDHGVLVRMVRCQRNTMHRPQVRRFGVATRKAWLHRRWLVLHPPTPYTGWASWYEDGAATASGYHAYYGVANRYLPFGTKVVFHYRGRSVTAVVDDRGPYVYPRVWDLNQNTAAALGFSGVGVVSTSVSPW